MHRLEFSSLQVFDAGCLVLLIFLKHSLRVDRQFSFARKILHFQVKTMFHSGGGRGRGWDAQGDLGDGKFGSKNKHL